MPIDPVKVLRRNIRPGRAWVLFANGTYVVFTKPLADMKSAAIELLRTWGPVHAGSPAGDFSVIGLTGVPGWAVAGHHRDVLTYVAPDELAPNPGDLQIGLLGRRKRDRDAKELTVVHEESWKDAPA
jgi:hypothetical protein